MNRLNLLRLLTGGLLVFAGVQCDRGKPTTPETLPTGALLIEARLAPAAKTAKTPVKEGRLRISRGVIVILDTLQVVDGFLRARVAGVPTGTIKVELYLLGAGADTLWQGENDAVNVRENETTQVTLQLRRVGDNPPSVQVAADPELNRIGKPFNFTAEVDDIHDADDSLQVQWDFDGDGGYDTDWSVAKEASHSYAVVGAYRVVVQVRDKSGQTNTNVNNTSSPTTLVRAIDLIAQAGLKGIDSVSHVWASPTERIPLNGKLSQGLPGNLSDSLVYHWKHLLNYPGAKQVSIENTFNVNKSRDAGEIRFVPSEGRGLYAFALTVEYAGVFSDPDTLLMRVRSRAPDASADLSGAGRVGEVVQLQGQGTDADGDSLRYRWRGAQVGLLSDSTSQSPTFIPAQEGSYVFELVVIDTDPQESTSKRVEIQVKPQNQAPVANAGPDAGGFTEVDIVLDGSGSSDPDGKISSYQWTSLDGPVLNDAASPRPVFRASDPRSYGFELVVNDGELDSLPDTIVVSLTRQNRPPLANAGADAIGQVGEVVRLNGAGSSDPDGDLPLQYRWTALDGGVLTEETQAEVEFSAAAPGEYQIKLVVKDSELESTPDTVRVRLKDLPRLVFAAVEAEAGDLEIYSARMDGSDRFRLTASPGEDLHPKTSPDGQTVVFASNRKGSVDIRTNETVYDIWRVNAEGADPTLMVETADWPALASDGRLAYSRNTGVNQDDPTDPIADIFVLELDGFESGPFSNSEDLSKNTQPSWSPEGRRLVYAKGHAQFGWDLFVVNLDGGETTQITTEVDSQEDEPAWSPDGTQIAFVSDRDGGDRGIFVVGPGGGNPTPLTGEVGVSHYSPSWSPDGSMIAYVRLDLSGKSDIYIMNADGSDPHLAIENAQDPAWLPGR